MTRVIADPLLFDKAAVQQQLAEQTAPLPVFKAALAKGYRYFTEQFKSGKDVALLVKQKSWLVDELLRLAWGHFIHSERLSLIAVGGYGRSELLLESDIDLMVLEQPPLSNDTQQQLAAFLAFLWDLGLKLGHSVRTIKVCCQQAKSDITTMTNIMESRLLVGDQKHYQQLCRQLTTDKIWPVAKYFTAKCAEQQQRHQKYDDSDHKLEPNVKESPGGLRDIQMISWVAKRHFDNIDLSSLVGQRFLTAKEYKFLASGRNFLWRVRFALHLVTQYAEDRLLFAYQREVAALFGYESDDNQAVEAFMKTYFKTVREIYRLNEMLLQHFEEAIIANGRRGKIQALNSRFQNCAGLIAVTNNQVFKRYPFALLEIFLLMQKHPEVKGIKASTIRLIKNHLYLIDAAFRKDIKHRSLFLEIIKQPNLVGHKLRLMHRYGVLAAYLPSFANIQGLMQFDLLHIFTVDEHILTVIRYMRLFGSADYKQQFPTCHDVIKKLPKLELLYLAGLFHDIAKGRGGDHAKLGAKDALAFCTLHQLSDYDAKLVAWLVEQHLVMSITAQKEDIDDPAVISRFVATVGDQIHLNYLYVLTIADIYGTNPKLWNSWKANLLDSLYHRTLKSLREGAEKPRLRNTRIKDTKHSALALLGKHQLSREAILKWWKMLGSDYFIRHSAAEIAWHTQGIMQHQGNQPLVLVHNFSYQGGSLIFVYMPNKKYIFATITSAIEQLGLNIVDAKIITTAKAYILDTFTVLEQDGQLIDTTVRAAEIETKILTAISAPPKPVNLADWQCKKLKPFNIPTTINFKTDEQNKRTIMEVVSVDYPGLLSQLSMAMAHCRVELQGAKIATFGERAEDIFYLQDNHRPISDPIKLECLTHSITTMLN